MKRLAILVCALAVLLWAGVPAGAKRVRPRCETSTQPLFSGGWQPCAWVKIKNGTYSQMVGRDELFDDTVPEAGWHACAKAAVTLQPLIPTEFVTDAPNDKYDKGRNHHTDSGHSATPLYVAFLASPASVHISSVLQRSPRMRWLKSERMRSRILGYCNHIPGTAFAERLPARMPDHL